MRTLEFEYRLVWRRQGDVHDRTKIFATTRPLYMFLLRVGTKQPWKGMGKNSLRAVTGLLAQALEIPMESILQQPIREVVANLTATHRPLLYLRVERRQVLKWTEVGDPLVTLRPMTYDAYEKRIDAFCNELDENPSMRWLPREQK